MYFRFLNCVVELITKGKSSLKTISETFRFVQMPKQSLNSFIVMRKYILTSAGLGYFIYWNYDKLTFCQEPVLCITENNSPKDYGEAILKCRDILLRLKDEVGSPGMVIGVSVNGKNVWQEAFGYSDVENRVKCTPDTVMRIASISKSITMAAVGKLWEENKLDLDKPIQFYVPDFPQKKFDGEQVEITCRQLISHLAGIRHYSKTVKSNSKEGTEIKKKQSTQEAEKENVKEFEFKEYYIKNKYDDIKSALTLFQDDSLLHKPGSKYLYSTHGWTLVSAIVEKVANEPFTSYMTKLFKTLGMVHTYLDVNDPLIYHRSRYYVKNKQGHLVNAPYVDNSYKWAGGGFLSTVGDLLLFGNAMLYSLQFQPKTVETEDKTNTLSSSVNNKFCNAALDIENANKDTSAPNIRKLPGFLKSDTIKTMWTPVTATPKDWTYAMGWLVLPEKQICNFCSLQPLVIAHTGGAVGASSILLILPEKCIEENPLNCQWTAPPRGVIVTILTNLQEVSLSKVAVEIAQMFNKATK